MAALCAPGLPPAPPTPRPSADPPPDPWTAPPVDPPMFAAPEIPPLPLDEPPLAVPPTAVAPTSAEPRLGASGAVDGALHAAAQLVHAIQRSRRTIAAGPPTNGAFLRTSDHARAVRFPCPPCKIHGRALGLFPSDKKKSDPRRTPAGHSIGCAASRASGPHGLPCAGSFFRLGSPLARVLSRGPASSKIPSRSWFLRRARRTATTSM